jgi:hypothetical protein
MPRAGKRLIFGAAAEKSHHPASADIPSSSLGRISWKFVMLMPVLLTFRVISTPYLLKALTGDVRLTFPCKFRRRSQHPFICASFLPSLDSLESHCERSSLRYVA